MRPWRILTGSGLVAAAVAIGLTVAHADSPTTTPSSTPIKHVVVLFDENISFDHYFGTYPNAGNPAGEPYFHPKANTPTVNGLNTGLLTSNPNSANPQRLDRSQAVTCDQDHGYSDEQKAADSGLMDKFVEFTAGGSCTDRSVVMDYYDGNTVTGLWNLAQGFSLDDNSFSTQFGPSTPGALNLISGQTHGATPATLAGDADNGTVYGDPDPAYDDCGNGGVSMSGKNVGDLMNAHNVTWGWFQGGFKRTAVDSGTGKATCAASHVNVGGATVRDYSAHHEPFEYYQSTANPHHLPASSPSMIGKTDQANHQYDLSDFDTAVNGGNLPQVSFLKASEYEDGHPGYSDPLDEQRFIAHAVDEIESSPYWSSTAIVIAYDDSDGWYDHVMSPILIPSASNEDALQSAGHCGNVKDNTAPVSRCGYGPRQPLLVVSPFARSNYVDSTLTDQSSITKFIEDNWQLGRIPGGSADSIAGSLGGMLDFSGSGGHTGRVFLNPTTGEVTSADPTTVGVGETSGSDAIASAQPSVANAAPSATANTIPVGSGPASSSGKASKLALSCTSKGKGRRVTIACTSKGTSKGTTALRFRLARGSKVYATSRTLLKAGKARTTLRTRRALKGKYTLRIAITQSGGTSSVSKSVRL